MKDIEIFDTMNTNMGGFRVKVYKLPKKMTDNAITQLSDDFIEMLECGDVIVKTDSTGGHAYIVSYKKDKVGICLTYTDASTVETVSYDYTDGHWVYNSTDVWQAE